MESQIKNGGFLKIKKPFNFWLKALRDSKVEAEKDRGERFQSRLATSFWQYHTLMR